MLHLKGYKFCCSDRSGWRAVCMLVGPSLFLILSLKERQMLISLHFCWILRNVFPQFSCYYELFLYIAPQATPMQVTEEHVKKIIRELPREDSTTLYITKIWGSPEAELGKKKTSVQNFHHNAEILRNLKYHHCNFWNQESWRKKIAGGT